MKADEVIQPSMLPAPILSANSDLCFASQGGGIGCAPFVVNSLRPSGSEQDAPRLGRLE